MLGVGEQPPSAIHFLNASSFKFFGAAVYIGLLKFKQCLACGLDGNPGTIRQSRHRAEHVTVFVGHRQHGDPDNANLIAFAPDRRFRDGRKELSEGHRHIVLAC